MIVLLTGGSGLVGRNFLEHAADETFEVLSPSHAELDLLDFRAVQAYLAEHRPDLIIHAAGTVGGIAANIRHPVRFLLENLDMGRNIVWAAHEAGIKRLINLGSSCMYPHNAANPLHEEMILKGEPEPTNEGYALAKIVTCRLCEYINREEKGCSYKTLIPCNLYGRFDNFDPSSSHLIPAVIHKIHSAMVRGDDSVEIWGDGHARREFMYAGDLAECLVEALRRFDTLPELMNVGSGTDYSVNEYYETVAEVVGYRGRFIHDLSKPVGMARKLVSVERSRDWGWQARTSLRDGIAKTYEFYLQEARDLR